MVAIFSAAFRVRLSTSSEPSHSARTTACSSPESWTSGRSSSAAACFFFSGGIRNSNSCKISSTSSTSRAPFLISLCDPFAPGVSIRPGTANTERPCSSAWSVVLSAPLFAPASTTTTPIDRPLTTRFRYGNVVRSG